MALIKLRLTLALLLGVVAPLAILAEDLCTENVLLVTFDGLRWQELFAGADETLMNREHGQVDDVEALKERFWRRTPQERREALLPFFWKVVARQGQVFGDPGSGSIARVTNRRIFSYPGYNEILAGVADSRILSNAKVPNRNVTVLEWLNKHPGFEGKVAAYCSWDVFPYILNEERSGVYVNAGWEPLEVHTSGGRASLFEEMRRELPHVWDSVRYDVFTLEGALGHLKGRHPRVLYVAFGETDDWAHGREYDLYLDAARRTDDYVRRLWEAVQADPQYAGKTSMVITTDHGRGSDPGDWTSHGADVAGSEKIWIAVLGPDTPELGVRKNVEVTQAQVAGTVATLLGEDFGVAFPSAAEPLPGILADR